MVVERLITEELDYDAYPSDEFDIKSLLQDNLNNFNDCIDFEGHTFDSVYRFNKTQKLLTAKEEYELGKKIFQGKRLRWKINQLEEELSRKLQVEEIAGQLNKTTNEVCETLQSERSAREKFIVSNIPLVKYIARGYVGRGVPLPDLIQEGNIGLMKAVDKFNYELGFKFSTYAFSWIERYMKDCIREKSSDIRLPEWAWEGKAKIKKESNRFEQINARMPTADEIAQLLDWNRDKVESLIQCESQKVIFSSELSAIWGFEESLGLDDIFADENQSTEDEASEKVLQTYISEVLMELNERERKVINSYYGLDSKQQTLLEISKQLKVSQERVRQIKDEALGKLIRSEKAKKLLYDYY